MVRQLDDEEMDKESEKKVCCFYDISDGGSEWASTYDEAAKSGGEFCVKNTGISDGFKRAMTRSRGIHC